jgi:hypothetical protein
MNDLAITEEIPSPSPIRRDSRSVVFRDSYRVILACPFETDEDYVISLKNEKLTGKAGDYYVVLDHHTDFVLPQKVFNALFK